MSFYVGLDFYTWLFVLLVPAIVLGLCQRSLRLWRAVTTIWFILLIYSDEQLMRLGTYALYSCVLVKSYALIRQRFGRNAHLYRLALLAALAPLVASKAGMQWDQAPIGFLGISYACFRVLQVLIETYDGIITKVSVPQFASFLLFFPTLSSGPIDRSRRFAEDDLTVWSRAEYLELLGLGLQKLVVGLLYKVVLSEVFLNLMNTHFAERLDLVGVAGYAYAYGLYLFFDFAGYSLLAVGTGHVLGIRVPDNFDKPFLSVDMKDFWNRWHISLSTWFRDFVFTRRLMGFIRHKRFGSRLTAASVALMMSMSLMGLWHGLEPHYIAYGLYHGVLMAVTEVFQKKSKLYKAHRNGRLFRLCSWALTINLVFFGFLIFSGHLGVMWQALAG